MASPVDTQQTGGWVRPKVVLTVAATFATDINSGVTSLIRYHRSSFVHYARPALRHTTTALHALPLTQLSCISDFPTLLGSYITYEPDDLTQILFFLTHSPKPFSVAYCHNSLSYISFSIILFYLRILCNVSSVMGNGMVNY